jgi:hypothetical protein
MFTDWDASPDAADDSGDSSDAPSDDFDAPPDGDAPADVAVDAPSD